MVMPLAGRIAAAVIGGLLVLSSMSSLVGTLIVSRQVSSRLTRWVDRSVDWAYQMVAKRVDEYRRRDRLLATQAAAVLLSQLATWLTVAYVGFALLLWPFAARGVVSAFIDAGSSMFTLGFAVPNGAVPAVIVFVAAAAGLVIVTLQIAYFPTLYASFNRRETEVALLNARGGFPSWGPELLARTHYALGTDMSSLDTMGDLYAQWERWASDVAESHTTYLPLVRFRSPQALSSWVTSLLAVLDSAALFLALSPKAAPEIPARLCLRAGFACFTRIARAMGFDIPLEADPDEGISLTYGEFLEAVARMREVNFPIEREPEEAWPDFVGWRVNYERAAYAVAAAVYAVPAMWSGPRRRPEPPIPPFRPLSGRVAMFKSGKPVRARSAGQQHAKEKRGQGADRGQRAEDRAAPHRAGPHVQRGRGPRDRHDRELDDERGPVGAAVVNLGPDRDDVPDAGDDQDAERRPGDLIEPAGGRLQRVGPEAAQDRDEGGQDQLAADPDGGGQDM
jgi:hypothetical protein